MKSLLECRAKARIDERSKKNRWEMTARRQIAAREPISEDGDMVRSTVEILGLNGKGNKNNRGSVT
jgi:hypothetical protein